MDWILQNESLDVYHRKKIQFETVYYALRCNSIVKSTQYSTVLSGAISFCDKNN